MTHYTFKPYNVGRWLIWGSFAVVLFFAPLVFTSNLAGTHGSEFTRLQILLYTWVLFAACLLPFMVGMSSWLYLAAAVVLSLWFCVYAWRLMRNYSDALARETFRFSLIHLSALFAALLLDHYLL